MRNTECGVKTAGGSVTQNSKPGPAAGRDHHRFGFTLWMAGGGVKGGQAVGKTDEFGWHAIENRVHINDFHATLLHLMGLDHLTLSRVGCVKPKAQTNRDGSHDAESGASGASLRHTLHG